MRTAELAQRARVNPQTLRYYERIGLLDPPPRNPAGYRDYPDEAVELLTFVGRAKDLGFNLDEISELLRLDDVRATSCETATRLAEHRIDDLNRRIADLQRIRGALTDLAKACTAGDIRPCPILDSLSHP